MSYVLMKFKTEIPDESPSESSKDPATELQSEPESEPSLMQVGGADDGSSVGKLGTG